MRRFPILFLVLALSASAQTLSNLRIAPDEDSNPDLTSGCVRFEMDVASLGGSTATDIEEGITTSLGNDLSTSNISSDDTYYWIVCHGTPSTTHYYRLTVGTSDTDCPVACTDCTSSDDSLFAADSNGINCGGIGEPINITHPAGSTYVPTAPTHADTNPYDDCDSDGSPTSTTCANLSSDLSTLAGTAGTHMVELPPGTCSLTSTLTLPTLTTATRICIRPELSDEDTRPIDRVGNHPGYEAVQVRFRYTEPYERNGLFTITNPVLDIPSGYTLIDTIVEDTPIVQNPIQATVTAVTPGTPGSSATTLTLSASCPAEFAQGRLVWLDMPGMTTYPAAGYINSCSGTTLSVNGGCGSACTNTTAFSGSLSGNGTATLGAIPISGAADNGSGAIRLTTAAAHGLPTGNYSDLDTVYVHNVEGTTEANDRWLFSVIDSTHIDLTGSTFANTYSASDYDFIWFFSYPDLSGVVDIADSADSRIARMTIGHPSPTPLGYTAMLGAVEASGSGIWDSIIHASPPKVPISKTDDITDLYRFYYTRSSAYIRADGIQDFQAVNNQFLGGGGIGLSFQNSRPLNRHLTIARNHFISTERQFPDTGGINFPSSLNYWEDNRHFIELKSGCRRCLIEENYFDTLGVSQSGYLNWAVGLLNSITTTGADGVYRQEDVEVGSNIFRNVGTAVGVGTQESNPTDLNNSFHSRVWIHDNFVEGASYELLQQPGTVTATTATASNSGEALDARFATQSLAFTNNTIYRSTGKWAGSVLIYQGDKLPGCVMDNNIYTYHRNASADEGFVRFGPSFSDYDETSNLTEFDKVCPDGSFDDNVIIAGVEDPEDVASLKASSADADTVTASEMSTDWPTSGSFATLDLGPSDSTYATRVASVFGSDREPEAAYSGHGVSDLDALETAVFGIAKDSVTVDLSGSTLTFTWTAPSTIGCTVRLSSDGWSTAESDTDTSGTVSQSASFTVGSGDYEAFIECAGWKPVFWAKTL